MSKPSSSISRGGAPNPMKWGGGWLMPRLDSLFALALAESELSLADFLIDPPLERTPAHKSLAYRSPQMRAGIARFAKAMFEQIALAMLGLGARRAID